MKPLSSKSPKRVMPAPDTTHPSVPQGGPDGRNPFVALEVEREAHGIVLAKRPATHRSIVDALEDPKLEVEAECDLHGVRAEQAEREVHRFVRQCQQRGYRWVLVIVGKGLHSPDRKSTLKDQVIDALSQRAPARFVLAFRTAPQRLGGTGALVLRLA